MVHYIFAIYKLVEANGYARGVDIARDLDIAAGSCSTGLKSLLKKWYILEDDNKMISLSELGQSIYNEINHNRRSLIAFFENTLEIPHDIAVRNACKMEHLIDPEVIVAMEKNTDN